jgi:hypothetical protein
MSRHRQEEKVVWWVTPALFLAQASLYPATRPFYSKQHQQEFPAPGILFADQGLYVNFPHSFIL